MSKGPFRSMSQRSWSRILIIHRSNLHFFSLLVEQNEQLKLHASIESSFFFLEEAAFSNRVQRHRTNMMIKLSVSYVTQKCKCPFSFRRTPIWDILWFVTFFFRGLVCMASDRGIRATAAMWLRVCFWQGERHICSTTPFARFATGPCRVHRTAASVATNGTMTVHMLWSTLDTCP